MLLNCYMGMNMVNHQSNNYRYERKYFIASADKREIESMILIHPALFQEVYYERYVNNIYFDNIHLDNFMDNIDGSENRAKYRIRWYGDMSAHVEIPILELKIKRGLVGTKQTYKLKSFKFDKFISALKLNDIIKHSKVHAGIEYTLLNQLPVLINRYRRKYYESVDRKFRLTVDDNQSFFRFNILNNSLLQQHTDKSNIILEMKYDIQHDSEADSITNHFPFRITKSSKYARGMKQFYC
jgi:SPX domain protein involved in polyphosphate accumulation